MSLEFGVPLLDIAPLTTGAAVADVLLDQELFIKNAMSLPEAITLSGCPERTLLDRYYNLRNDNRAIPINCGYDSDFEFEIQICDNAFLGEMYLKFTRPALVLLANNRFGNNGFISMKRDFAFNVFQYLHLKIDNDQKLIGEMSSDTLIANTYFDLLGGLREALFDMVGNVREQIQPHGVGRFIPSYTYIVPLKTCFNESFLNRFPIAALGITKRLRLCGRLKPLEEMVQFGNSTLLNRQQPYFPIRRDWLSTRNGDINQIYDFNLYFKASRIPDFNLNAMVFGAEQRNVALEVFDPNPLYEYFDIYGSDGERFKLGEYSNLHHIFLAVKNVSNPSVGSCYSTLTPELTVAPGVGPGSSLGSWTFNPAGNHSPYESVEFIYGDCVSEVIDHKVMQSYNPYEVCVSTPQFHTVGLGLKSFDPFRLHPRLNANWPSGNVECIDVRINPSRFIRDRGDVTLNLNEVVNIGETILAGTTILSMVVDGVITDVLTLVDTLLAGLVQIVTTTVDGVVVQTVVALVDFVATALTNILGNVRFPRPRYKLFVSCVTVQTFRIERGSIAPVVIPVPVV